MTAMARPRLLSSFSRLETGGNRAAHEFEVIAFVEPDRPVEALAGQIEPQQCSFSAADIHHCLTPQRHLYANGSAVLRHQDAKLLGLALTLFVLAAAGRG